MDDGRIHTIPKSKGWLSQHVLYPGLVANDGEIFNHIILCIVESRQTILNPTDLSSSEGL